MISSGGGCGHGADISTGPVQQRKRSALGHIATGMQRANHQQRVEESSSPGESHPQALPEPYVNLSAHTAHIIQSHPIPYQAPSAQRAAADEHELGSATDLL